LGRRVRIHTLPELHFHYDPSVETGNRISALIDKALESDRLIADEAGGKSDDEEGGTPSADR
jgi:ribosome-binding factor A